MEDVNIKKENWPAMVANLLIDVQARQIAQTNLIVDFLAATSNKSPQELMDSIKIRQEIAKKDILTAIYAEYGSLPFDLKDIFSNE